MGQMHELRLALLALFTVSPTLPDGACARLLDDATAVAAIVDDELIGVANIEGAATVRRRAVRLVNELCGQCRACPRGRTGEGAATLTAPAPVTQLVPRRDL